MIDPFQLLIDAGAIPSSPFDQQSRYHGVALAVLERRPGEPGIAYVRRRFTPAPGRLPAPRPRRAPPPPARHIVRAQDRPDLLGATYFGDALLYWRIADAN